MTPLTSNLPAPEEGLCCAGHSPPHRRQPGGDAEAWNVHRARVPQELPHGEPLPPTPTPCPSLPLQLHLLAHVN